MPRAVRAFGDVGRNWVYAVSLVVWAGIGFAVAAAFPNVVAKVVGAVVGLVCLCSAPLELRRGRVLVFEDHVVVRELWRTRRWPFDRVERFVAADRPLRGGGRRFYRILGAWFDDGETRWAVSANAVRRHGARTWVDDAADDLNDRLRRWRDRNGQAPSSG